MTLPATLGDELLDLIPDLVSTAPGFDAVLQRLPAAGGRLVVGGCEGSLATSLIAALAHENPRRVLIVVAHDPALAASAEVDLESLLGEGVPRLYPQREALPYDTHEPHLELGGLRVEAVEALYGGTSRVLVTTVRALQERAPIPEGIERLRLSLSRDEEFRPARLVDELEARGFERVPLVEQVGQYAVRGGLVDVFSFGSPEPLRIEFWGDEISSIRTFDVMDQRSKREVDTAHVLPVDFEPGPGGDDTTVPRSLLELLPAEALLVSLGSASWDRTVRRTWQEVLDLHADQVARGHAPEEPDQLFLTPEQMKSAMAGFAQLTVTSDREGDVVFEADPAPAIDRDIERLRTFLREGVGMGHRTLIVCDNEGQIQRLEEILGGPGSIHPSIQLAVGALASGFTLRKSTPPLRVLTDHQIFRRSRRVRTSRRFRGAAALESIAQLSPGDYVVHMDHGIGMFKGLQHIVVAGEGIEAMAIEYSGGEVLRVPVYRLDLVERWVGESEGAEAPTVHRIGGKRWKNLRTKTEKAIELMATELLELYAERETSEGFACAPDSTWQKEMESSFLYEDTPDQRKATDAVKRDLESRRPMDRLICGDVGYGKTEIAIRAAFKVVQEGRQVAVLAPTTILVEQHRHTFEERLADYPVRVGALSRFRSQKEQKELLGRLASGDVDILIGTHRLLSQDVTFKELGLLIVDEEQRFGVRHKERLRKMRASVDVLTLTATPIPRTLQLSLGGLRDLSLIQTPPRDRMPIITHILPWSDQILREACRRELDRGGQVYFLHNRIDTLGNVAAKIRSLVPDAGAAIAHGQMRPRELDEAVRGFVDGEVDVLVCSAIIENGLDVPNANTLIVDRADHFGLSQLYQIRGRVGRSNRRAYAYFLTPDNIEADAERRLRVLEHYTELGSGYAVALKDLEIRGAGNLLGANQSGFAHAVGIDTYLRLLERAVRRLRQAGEEGTRTYPQPEISLGGAAYLPDAYIPDASQKLHLYRKLSRLEDEASVRATVDELSDRFGPPPAEVERLLEGQSLRLLGQRLGIERILIRDRNARITFRAGVVPRLAALQKPFVDRQIEVEVRRMEPLSVALHQDGPEPLTSTLIRALSRLVEGEAATARPT